MVLGEMTDWQRNPKKGRENARIEVFFSSAQGFSNHEWRQTHANSDFLDRLHLAVQFFVVYSPAPP
jgi:hypothetical protein